MCKSGSIFSKTAIFDPFFPEISGIFGDSGDFPGKNFPEIGEFSGGIFPEDFPEIGCIFARTRKKQEKNARFFRGFPGDFPGDFPGISRRLFSEKTRIFLDFHPVLPTCTLFRSARSGKNPQISGKVPGDFRNSRESPEKISRNSREFPKFPKFPRDGFFRKLSPLFRNFRIFWYVKKNVNPTCNDYGLLQYYPAQQYRIVSNRDQDYITWVEIQLSPRVFPMRVKDNVDVIRC